MLKIFLSVFLLATVVPCFAKDQSINLDIEVFQALREGVKGVDFNNEYARIGLPFPDGMVEERNGRASLALEGTAFQTRVLKRWPSGSVKWALVEFLASPSKGHSEQVHLTNGAGVSAGPPLAMEKNGRVLVDTGPMQVEIRKNEFNLFDKVVVGGKDIVQSNQSRGAVLVDGSGREFLASSCEDVRVTLEENGPVKAVVRADGGFCNGNERRLDFTGRLFFYKGKSRATVQFTLRNASRASVEHVFIKSMALETQLDLGNNPQARISSSKGEKELDLQKGSVSLYQAVSDFPWLSDGDSFYYHGPIAPIYERENQRGYKQEGYWISQAGQMLEEGKRSEFPDIGYMNVTGRGGRGATVGVRYMAGQWPKALKADSSGTAMVALWPEENGQGYWIRYGSHNTFETMYSFHPDATEESAGEMARFQYPLVARAPVEWYNKNVAGIYPLYHLLLFSNEKKLAEKLGIGYGVGWRKPKFKVWRYHYWGHGGFLNQHDFSRIALGNFLREDRDLVKAGESALMAESMISYYTDWAVYHSDDYDYGRLQPYPKENNLEAGLAKVVFEWEHQHWYGMPLYYYMTGDERVREAVLDWGEHVKQKSNPLSLTYMRVFGTGMFSLAAMYEFTGDTEFMRLADLNFQNLLNAKFNPQKPYANIFIDWERGCIIGGSGSGWNPEAPEKSGVKADLLLGSIMYDGLLNYRLLMEKGNPQKDSATKLLLKISDFMLKEPYFEGTKGGKKEWAYWIPYLYNLADRDKSDHGYKLAGQASYWAVFPYGLTGDEKWLKRMAKMMKMALWDDSGVWGSYGYIDHPGYQTMGYILAGNILAEGRVSDGQGKD